MLGTCHFEKKIVAIFQCHYKTNGTHNSVSLNRKAQSHKIKRRFVVHKDARFITLYGLINCASILWPNKLHCRLWLWVSGGKEVLAKTASRSSVASVKSATQAHDLQAL